MDQATDRSIMTGLREGMLLADSLRDSAYLDYGIALHGDPECVIRYEEITKRLGVYVDWLSRSVMHIWANVPEFAIDALRHGRALTRDRMEEQWLDEYLATSAMEDIE